MLNERVLDTNVHIHKWIYRYVAASSVIEIRKQLDTGQVKLGLMDTTKHSSFFLLKLVNSVKKPHNIAQQLPISTDECAFRLWRGTLVLWNPMNIK